MITDTAPINYTTYALPFDSVVHSNFLNNNLPDKCANLIIADPPYFEVKGAFDLERFRTYMMTFHLRLAKLPKTTRRPKTQRRVEYMMKVAELFGITPDKPFSGKFYFELLTK